jgi:hypothetical protein
MMYLEVELLIFATMVQLITFVTAVQAQPTCGGKWTLAHLNRYMVVPFMPELHAAQTA